LNELQIGLKVGRVLLSMDTIIELAEEVFSTLKCGYPERVYHNALEVQLRLHGIPYETERVIQVFFKNHIVGHIRADLIVNNSIVVELKSVAKIKDEHTEQCGRYMKLLNYNEGVVINFPEKGDKIDVVELVTEIKKVECDTGLYEILRKERSHLSKELNLPPYCILYNSVLVDISIQKPKTIEELLKIKGIKQVKAEKYGERIIQLVKDHSI
jgi:GxxExxY protein